MIYLFSQLTLRLILIGLAVFFSLSCQTFDVPNPQKEAEQVYRKDLEIEVDGKTYYGVGVLPRKSNYKITIHPEGNIDRLIIQSCNREIVADKPEVKGWFNHSYSFTYWPLVGLEDNRTCPIEIASLEEKKTRNGFGYLDFRDARPEISLRSSIKCNGEYQNLEEGVGICQAPSGLRQQIFFQTQVLLEAVEPKECDVMESKDGFFWEWNMAPRKCIYYFVARQKHANGNRLAFRLNALGFTVVPYRPKE